MDLLFQQNISGLVAALANSSVFIWIAWSHVDHAVLLVWYAVSTASFAARVIGTYEWSKRKSRIQSFADIAKWNRFIEATLFMSGLSWGFCAWISVNSPSTVQHILASLLVFGMSVGAVVAYAPSLGAMYAVSLPALSLWAIRLFLTLNSDFMLLGLLVSMFGVLAVFAGRKLNSFVTAFLRMNALYQESEERLRMARDSCAAINWDWSPLRDVFLCEGHIDVLCGVDRPFHSGRLSDFLTLFAESERETIAAIFARARASGEMDCEQEITWADGSKHWLALRGKATHFSGNQIDRLSGICWDVTTKNTEEILRRERDVFEATNKRQLVFLANVSHEIRTPLAAINGFAEYLLDGESLSAKVREKIHVILRNGKHLSAIVNDLLDLSKLETDKLYFQVADMSPVAELKDCLALIAEGANQKKLDVKIEYATKMPESIQTDAVRFRQILINVLTNAIKYTDYGGIRIRLSCAPDAESRQWFFKVLVTDTGVGMSDETKAGLFQPFVRGDALHVRRVPGSGLGLALSRKLARNLGGDLRLVESSPGMGSAFEIAVTTGPLDDARMVDGETLFAFSEGDGGEPGSIEPVLSGKKLLLVEDDPDLLILMRGFLERYGAHVDTAVNGAEAVDLALEKPYDVVLMDIKMPVMDGYQATRELRGKGYGGPIVALTAHASAIDMEMATAAGCNGYLSKPVDTHLLLETVTGQG